MKNYLFPIAVSLSILVMSCSESPSNVDDVVESQTSFCGDSDKDQTLRLEVKCDSCEVKYKLFKDSGNDEGKESIDGVWCKEINAQPTDIIGLFATKLENGKPIEFTLADLDFEDGVPGDSVEVRVYYNNELLNSSIGNGYAGVSMEEIPY